MLFFFNDTTTTEIYTLSLPDALPILTVHGHARDRAPTLMFNVAGHTSAEVAQALAEREGAVWHGNYYAWGIERHTSLAPHRSEEHTSELQSRQYIVCRLLLDKKKNYI